MKCKRAYLKRKSHGVKGEEMSHGMKEDEMSHGVKEESNCLGKRKINVQGLLTNPSHMAKYKREAVEMLRQALEQDLNAKQRS